MTVSIEEHNAALRAAVEHRNDAQAAGKPHEEWYGGCVTQTLPERHIAADLLHDATRMTDEDVERLSEEDLDDAIERLTWADRMRAQGGATAADIVDRFGPQGSAPFLALLEELRRLHLSKSQDYGSESDPLANIRQGAEFVGIEAWRGCMVRIADKVQRLRTYCQTGRLVHEGVRDTLLDLSAYSLLAIVLFDEGKDA